MLQYNIMYEYRSRNERTSLLSSFNVFLNEQIMLETKIIYGLLLFVTLSCLK